VLVSITLPSWLSKSLHSIASAGRSHLIQQHSMCEHFDFCVAYMMVAKLPDTAPTNKDKFAQSTILLLITV